MVDFPGNLNGFCKRWIAVYMCSNFLHLGAKTMKKMKDYLDPPKILVLGFATVILIGAFLLTLPIATEDGKGLSFLNALFTATSATCVTGLVVVDTGRYIFDVW